MNASTVLWNEWQEQVKELMPSLHGHQQKTLALFIIGVVLSGCAVLQKVAETLSQHGISSAKMPSIERRLERFLANRRICVETIWDQVLAVVLPSLKQSRLLLVLDLTPFNEEASIIYIGVLIHSRVLPLAWCVMPQQESWDQGLWPIVERLMQCIQAHLEDRQSCTLLADRGLVGRPLVRLCQQYHWHYLLRLCKHHTCRRAHGSNSWSWWCSFAQLVTKPGYSWYGRARVWQEEPLETNVSLYWEPGTQEAWILISDQAAGKIRVEMYALRMRAEATFQDTKSRGWDLESSLVKDLSRLHRLLLVVAFAMWWVTHLASSCLQHGHRDRFDRHDRRDKGIFRLGRLWLLEVLKNVDQLRTGTAFARLVYCLPFQRRGSQWKCDLHLWRAARL
jgi:hypothetical protein